MDNHQWRLSQAYTYEFHISIHISTTSIPYHFIFLLHVKLFLLHVLCIWHILYLYFFCIPISSTLPIPILIMSLVYVFFIFRFYDLLNSSLSYLYYHILSDYMRSFCTFHILLSCTIHILHIHLYILILSIIYFVLLYTFYTFSFVYILIFISNYNVLLVLVTVCIFIA